MESQIRTIENALNEIDNALGVMAHTSLPDDVKLEKLHYLLQNLYDEVADECNKL